MNKGVRNNRTSGMERRPAILPPGIEELSEVIYGELEVHIKKLNYLNVLHKEGNVRVRFNFFGENKGVNHLLVPQNASQDLLNHFKNSEIIEIGCSIWKFADYLADMSVLRLSIVDHLNQEMGFVEIQFEQFIYTDLTEKSESVFKDLKGNFSIQSSTNPHQKIGSLDVEIRNWFDPEISWIVKQAEMKFSSGQLSSPIEEYVNDQVLGRARKVFRTTQDFASEGKENNNYNNNGMKDTASGQMAKDSARSRVPYSLQENNSNYAAMRYTSDKLGLAEEEAEEEQRRVDEQRIQFKEMIEREKQQMINAEENIKRQAIMRQQQEKIKAQEKAEEKARQQEKLRQSQFGKSALAKMAAQKNNQGIDTHRRSQSQSQFKEDGKKSTYDSPRNKPQFIDNNNESIQNAKEFKELERANRAVSMKMDKLIGVGEELLGEYLRQKEESQNIRKEKFDQRRIEANKLTLIAQNAERLAKELEQQKMINQRLTDHSRQPSQGGTLQQNSKNNTNNPNANIGYFPQQNQQQQKLYEQSQGEQGFNDQLKKQFPVNRSLFDKNVLRVKIYGFSCTDTNFWNKVKYKNLYIENDIPNSIKMAGQGAEPPDKTQFKAVCKNTAENEFSFNQEFSYQLDIKPEVVSRILREKITFKLQTFSIPKNTIEIDKNANLVFLLAEGGISMGEFMARSKNFSGLFHLEMKTKLQSQAKMPDSKGPTIPRVSNTQAQQTLKVNKDSLKPIENNEELPVGILKASIQILRYDEIDPRKTFAQHQATAAFLQATSAGAVLLHPPKPSFSFQILLILGKLKFTNPHQYLGRVFYASYKIYGTSESLITRTVNMQPNVSPDLQSIMTISAPKEVIVKMKKVPLVIEIWEKKDLENDDTLIGLVNISLTSISNSVLTRADNFNANWCSDTSNKQQIIVSDCMESFKPIASDSKLGSIHVQLIFGSAMQIANYKNNTTTVQKATPRIEENMSIIQNDIQVEVEQKNLNKSSKDGLGTEISAAKNNQANIFKNQKELEDEDARINASEKKHFEEEKRAMRAKKRDEEFQAVKEDKLQPASQFGKYVFRDGVIPTNGDELIEVFEELRSKSKRVSGRIREFMQHLRGPSYFLKTTELFEFLAGLPVEWRSQATLISFARAFDAQDQGYYPSQLFMKSYSAYTILESSLRSKLTSLVFALRDVLSANRITTNEFERNLNGFAEFGFARKQTLIDGLLGLNIAGLDKEILQNISVFLVPEDVGDPTQEQLICTGLLIEYLRQVETYACVRAFAVQDEKWYINAVVGNLKAKIEQTHVQLAILANQKTQGILEVTTLKLLEILDSAGIETSFWEAYLLLKEIASFCGIDTSKSPSKLSVNVIQLNQYILEIERMIQAESKLAGVGIVQDIMDNESDLRDLNALLNNNNNAGKEVKNVTEDISFVSYWFSLRVDQLTEIRNDVELPANKRIDILDLDMNAEGEGQENQGNTNAQANAEELDWRMASLRYKLPLESERWVESSAFGLGGRTTLKIYLHGTHSIVLQKGEDLSLLFNDTKIPFELKLLDSQDSSIAGQASLEVSHLSSLVQADTDYAKRNTHVRLETLTGDFIGYLSVNIEFRRQFVKNIEGQKGQQDQILQKNEQKIQKLLPKQGYLCVSIQPEGLDCLDGKQCIGECVIFRDDSYLNHLFKPFEGYLPIINHQSFLSMSAQVITYFQESPAQINIYDYQHELIAMYDFSLVELLLNCQLEENVTLLNSATNTPFNVHINIAYNKNQIVSSVQ